MIIPVEILRPSRYRLYARISPFAVFGSFQITLKAVRLTMVRRGASSPCGAANRQIVIIIVKSITQ